VTVLHGDPATGPSDVFLRAPADYTFPAHWHTSAEHMVVVAGVVHVTYAGSKQFELRERTYALVPAKTGHKAHCGVGGPCVMFIRFDSPIDAAPATDVP
jgi:mannose-6-phosphate isomerase-like protein (cupin superfamily)